MKPGTTCRALDAAATAAATAEPVVDGDLPVVPEPAAPVVPQTNHVVAPEKVRLASFCARAAFSFGGEGAVGVVAPRPPGIRPARSFARGLLERPRRTASRWPRTNVEQ